jgi:hypothetical protein
MRPPFWHKLPARLASLVMLAIVAAGPLAGHVTAVSLAMVAQKTSSAPLQSSVGQRGEVALPLAVAGAHDVYIDNGAVQNSITGYRATSAGLSPCPARPILPVVAAAGTATAATSPPSLPTTAASLPATTAVAPSMPSRLSPMARSPR